MSTEAEEQKMAATFVRWRDRILKKAACGVESHFLDGPDDEHSEEEQGFERGLRTAVDEICKLMADPSYFGRKPQTTPTTQQP